MENKNIVIHGSCVSRDIFRIHPQGFNIRAFFSRTSIPSVVSQPWPVQEEDFAQLASQFQRRSLLNDFNKTFFSTLQEIQLDYFLIDLIDERLNLILSEGCLLTNSPELVNSKFLEHTARRYSEIDRLAYPLDLWEQDCERYLQRLTQIVPQEKIIIIKGLWSEQYRDSSGQIRDLDGIKHFKKARIQKMNQLFNQYYEYLASRLPGAKYLSFPQYIADENHFWGLSTAHYLPSIYANMYQQLCAVCFAR